MGKPNRRVVLGVGPRSRRYDLRYSRAKAVYVDDVEDAPRMARAYPVAGAVVTGESIHQVIECVRALRGELDPSAVIAVVDPGYLGAEEELRAAGATLMADSFMRVHLLLGVGVKSAAPRKPRALPVAELLPVLLPRRTH